MNYPPTFMAARHMLSAVAAATLLACHPAASALTLGRLTVQSALGEALVADIDVTSMSAEEAASLTAALAPPDVYRANSVEFNPVLSDVRVKLLRRPDGAAFIRISGDRAVIDPFLDLIVNFSWTGGGTLQRSFTLLVDPRTSPGLPAVTVAPVLSVAPPPVAPVAGPAAVAATPVASTATPAAAPAVVAAPAEAAASAPGSRRGMRHGRVANRVAAKPAKPAVEDSAPTSASTEREYVVRHGDTLARIAQTNLPAGVSLDQMLVSLYHSNQDAFIGRNMNRLKAGAVLTLPDAEAAKGVAPKEAKRVIRAQSADFAAFRQTLASAAPQVKTEDSGRQSGGKVDAAVQDRKPGTGAAASGDQLTLSRGGAKPGGAEARVSEETKRKAEATRTAELARNVEELKKLAPAGAPAAPSAAAAKPGASKPAAGPTVPLAGVPAVPAVAPPPAKPMVPAVPPAPPVVPPAPAKPVAPPPPPPVVPSAPAKPLPPPAVPALPPAPPLVAPVVASAPPVLPSAPASVALPAVPSAPASAALVASAASMARPASVPVPRPPMPKPAEPEEESFLDMLPAPVIPIAAGLVALLAGLGAMKLWRRRRESASETSFIESKLQADSFFGASGGQRVDTRESGAPSSSSLSYSLSQLDAIGDVDPVAEADVYLAYGRDLQAEEILKEALRTDPNRLAIRVKLLEVYAKREDARSFEQQVRQIQEITGGVGDEWQRAMELGQQLEPGNPLYRSAAGSVDLDTSIGDVPAPDDTRPTQPLRPGGIAPVAQPDLDLDIDLDAPSQLTGLENTRPVTVMQPPELNSTLELPKLDAYPELSGVGSVQVQADAGPSSQHSGLDFSLSDLSLDLGAGAAPAAAPAPAEPPMSMLDFDDFTADLGIGGGAAAPAPALEAVGGSDPLAQKIELADEFRLIGDEDGARELLKEVMAKGSPALKQRAQAMLNELG